MMFLSGVETQRVVDVNTGKRKGRGCGKTIAKMVTLLSKLRYSNGGKRYLFICENNEMAKDINYYFYFWIADVGFYADSNIENHATENREYNVTINPPRPKTGWEMLKSVFRKSREKRYIFIKFVPAKWKVPRGTRKFDSILIDVSEEAREKYSKEISEALSYEQKNW